MCDILRFLNLDMNSDPSAIICSFDTSFNTVLYDAAIPQEYIFQTKYLTVVTPNLIPLSVDDSPDNVYCNTQRYDALQKVKDTYTHEHFEEARLFVNPFENIGRSIFINRAAVKLANIDAVCHITTEQWSIRAPQSNERLTFCDVAAGPGSFTQYLQYRYPHSKGYGMTLRDSKLDWDRKALDLKRFTPFYGSDNTGNLYTNYQEFIDMVLSQEPLGVDLVTADGGFDLENSSNDRNTSNNVLLRKQEFLSSRLLLTQCVIGLNCCRVGGNFVVKVFDTVTEFSAQVLYVLSQCFDEIIMFKPVSSRPANSERYVICRGRLDDIQQYRELLTLVANSYGERVYFSSIISEPLPEPWTMWLTIVNDRSINSQLEVGGRIITYLKGGTPTVPKYNLPKFLMIWALPDTPRKRTRTYRR